MSSVSSTGGQQSGAHQGGYSISIFREKIVHIPKSRKIFSIFPIPNFYPIEHCCSRLRALFETVIIEQLVKQYYKVIIGA